MGPAMRLYVPYDIGVVPAFDKGSVMNPMKIVGIVLIVAGAAALAYGGFSYTKETHNAEIGPLKLSVKEKEQVNVPQWAGIGAIVVGVVLLVLPSKK
jgi:drug/metabolite transporter (DMT)-like permease